MLTVDERICTKCRIVKPLDDFSVAPRGKYGRKASCKECDAARHAALHPPKPRVSKPRREPLPGTAEKRCKKCGVMKTIDEFPLSRKATSPSRNDVYRSDCKPCCSDRTKEYYRNNPEWAAKNKRVQNLKSYGLTIEEYDALHAAQNGKCAICGEEETATRSTSRGIHRLTVDHRHDVANTVRGLLCVKCNRAIGMLQDSPALLRRAADYLEEKV